MEKITKKCNKCLEVKKLDHVVPLSTAKKEEDIIKLNHYTNLQPLCSKINRDIKKDKVE